MRRLEQGYNEIADGLGAYLERELEETVVFIEEEMIFSPDQIPAVFVYFDRRELAERQFMRAGKRTDYILVFSIWGWQWDTEVKNAARKRNELVGALEATLMADKTIGGLVETSFLRGGDMTSARIRGELSGFASGGEVVLAVQNPIILTEEQ